MIAEQAFDLAMRHHASGRSADAEVLCRQILGQHPHHAGALFLLATLDVQAGRPHDAAALFRQVLRDKPDDLWTQLALGALLQAQGALDEAAGLYERVLRMSPTNEDACNRMGNIERARGNLQAAIDWFRRAVQLRPEFSAARSNLGLTLEEAGQPEESVVQLREALRMDPDRAEIHHNLGIALTALGRLEEAAVAHRRAVDLNPAFAPAHNNLGNVIAGMGRLDEALTAHQRAVDLEPENAMVRSNLILSLQYQLEGDGQAILKECLRMRERHAAPLQPLIAPHHNDRAPERALRVGYVSPDLRTHSVAFFLLPLLEAHDRQAFPVTCYSTSAKADAVTERLRAASDRWCSVVGVSDESAARRIRDDGIDILVDLSGHTSNNRLLLFARKPAPVQITYLGFPGTTGLSAIDYRLTDAYADPPGAERYGTEQLVRLAECAWCYAPLSGSPPVAALPALHNGYVTFGSFNNLAKLTPHTLTLWARILQRLPASRLLLKGAAFRSPEAVARFRRQFEAHAIAAQRMELLADEPSLLRHLQYYDRVDIALDSFPYHGTTTTCEALWMGAPVITLAGQRHGSRVGVSLLSTTGLAECIAHSDEDYAERAVALAEDLPRLQSLRAELRERMRASALMDAPRFARNLESAYRIAWRQWCDQGRQAA